MVRQLARAAKAVAAGESKMVRALRDTSCGLLRWYWTGFLFSTTAVLRH